MTAVLFTPLSATAQSSSPCPPGQPSGRPPGVPPGPPANTPPSARGQYPPGECNLKVSQSAAARGEEIGISGGGFVPGEVVVLRLDPGAHVLGNVTADASGVIAASVVIPAGATTGDNRVLASTGSRELAASLQVTAPVEASRALPAPAVGGRSLAATGVAAGAIAATGLGLVLVGLVLVRSTRRRLSS